MNTNDHIGIAKMDEEDADGEKITLIGQRKTKSIKGEIKLTFDARFDCPHCRHGVTLHGELEI